MRRRWRRPHGPPGVPILLDDRGAREGVHDEAGPPRPRYIVSALRPPLAVRVRGLRETEALQRSRFLRESTGVLLPRVRSGAPRGLEEILGVDVLVPPTVPMAGTAPPPPGPTPGREPATPRTTAPHVPAETSAVAAR